jgi:hypothetical protein
MTKPKTAFYIFLDDFALLYREEYDKYHVFTAEASKVWKELDKDIKEYYHELSRIQRQEYKIRKKLS